MCILEITNRLDSKELFDMLLTSANKAITLSFASISSNSDDAVLNALLEAPKILTCEAFHVLDVTLRAYSLAALFYLECDNV